MPRNNHEFIQGMVIVRNYRLHISALMLLRIVDDLNVKTGSAAIGEVLEYYRELSGTRKGRSALKGCRSKGTPVSYTYSGVASMLRTLAKSNFLKKGRDGHYVEYTTTDAARSILDLCGF